MKIRRCSHHTELEVTKFTQTARQAASSYAVMNVPRGQSSHPALASAGCTLPGWQLLQSDCPDNACTHQEAKSTE